MSVATNTAGKILKIVCLDLHRDTISVRRLMQESARRFLSTYLSNLQLVKNNTIAALHAVARRTKIAQGRGRDCT